MIILLSTEMSLISNLTLLVLKTTFTMFRWFVCGAKLHSFHVGNQLVTANFSNLWLLISGRRKLQMPFSELPPQCLLCIWGLDHSHKYWADFKVVPEDSLCYSQLSDNMADNLGITYRSGLHQLNELRLNISTALKPFEMDEEKRGISSKTPGLTPPSMEGGGWAAEQTGI